MRTDTTPPKWADALLRLFLRPEVFVSVSGDLLEQYRDSIYPARGRHRADRWYVQQVLGFLLRGTRLWAVLFAGSFVARDALDMLRPTTDFSMRSEISTALAAGILLAAGFWCAWRSGSFAAGAVAGLATTAAAAVLSIAGSGVLLAIWHDPNTMAAIRGSGGVEECFSLPFLVILPGVTVAGLAGVVGAMAKLLVRTG